jgi:hypothetical protein
MNLTPEQIAANRKSAMNLALSKTGLTDIPKTEWTYDQRGEYNKALADLILQYPDRFGTQDVSTAHDVKQADYSPLANADFSFSDFGSEVVSNANDLVGKPLVSLGQGVGNVFSFIGNFGPYLALAAGLFIAYQFVKAKGKQASKA